MNGIIFTSLPDNWSLERPAGAYRIAHYLRKEFQNIDVEVVDYLMFWKEDELLRLLRSRIKRNNIKWIGISITWITNYHLYISLCNLIRKYYPELKIIVGGQDIFYKEIPADYYINGYGENAITAVLRHAFGNGKITGVPVKGGWMVNAMHFYPAWPPTEVKDSYEIIYEKRDFLTPNDVLTLEFQRGCKFACKYCSYPILNVKGDTSRTQEDIQQELQRNYDSWGITNYAVADETINNNDDKLIKISNAVKSLSFQPNFTGFVRLDLLYSQRHHIELLMESRIWGHYYGVETFNHETGKIIGKGLDPEKNKYLATLVRDTFNKNLGVYRGTISMIVGLPKESKDSIFAGALWLKNTWKNQSFDYYPLTISKKQQQDVSVAKLSAFGEDFSKYGYKEMIDSEKFGIEFPENYYGDHRGAVVLWENDHINFIEATTLANNFNDPTRVMGNWELWGASSGCDDNIVDICNNNKNRDDYAPAFIGRHKKVSSYIENKLALY